MSTPATPQPTPTPSKPKIAFGEILTFIEHALVDAEALAPGSGTGPQKRAAVVDLIGLGLQAYADVEGKTFDLNLVTNDLLALLEMAVKTYNDLGLFPSFGGTATGQQGSAPATK